MSSDPRQIIAIICPELSASPSLSVILTMASEVTDKCFFGKMYSYAIAYRACHIFMVSGGADNSGIGAAAGLGQITGMSEGGLSVSFAVGSVSADYGGLETTKFGKMLLGLIKSRPTMGVNMAGLNCQPHGGC
ncbi:MAG: DUF4054 domain-containing protein [Spirochaetaceae bacterium]|jgi:hypothetical protein|nr:DUF4054 domain-containing protein [Spirochaetaceae bacterium]